MKSIVILLIVAIIASLAFALRSMLRPKSDAPERTAKMLTVRIGLSLLLFALLMLGYKFGLIGQHGL